MTPRLTHFARKHLAHTCKAARRKGFRCYNAATRPSPRELLRQRKLAKARALRSLDDRLLAAYLKGHHDAKAHEWPTPRGTSHGELMQLHNPEGS